MAERVSLVAHIEAHELPVFDGARKVLTYPAISVFKVGAAGGRDSEFHRPADISALAARCSYVGAIRARTATIIRAMLDVASAECSTSPEARLI